MLNIKEPKDYDAIREIINIGMKSDFWKLIIQDLKEARKHLQKIRDSENLNELPADQYKLKSELLKAKIKYIDILIDTPKDLVSWLQDPDNKKPIFDPYE